MAITSFDAGWFGMGDMVIMSERLYEIIVMGPSAFGTTVDIISFFFAGRLYCLGKHIFMLFLFGIVWVEFIDAATGAITFNMPSM